MATGLQLKKNRQGMFVSPFGFVLQGSNPADKRQGTTISICNTSTIRLHGLSSSRVLSRVLRLLSEVGTKICKQPRCCVFASKERFV